MNKFIFFTLILLSFSSWSQVGIGTVSPEGALDIFSEDSGVLLPRVALSSPTDVATVLNPGGGTLVEGTMVWHTGTAGLPVAGYYYWQNSQWISVLSSNQSSVHIGKLIINSSGVVGETGIGFSPTAVEFIAVNRVQGYDDGAYRSGDNNTNDIRMAGGFTTGYATNYAGMIEQQVISNAFNGSSINNIGTYSSESHCIAAFFTDSNGSRLRDNGRPNGGGTTNEEGLVRASLQSFDADGFTLNVDRFLSPPPPTTGNPDRTNVIVVVYKAYR